MARGRIIKPEFWTSESVLSMTMTERLFFIGFWNFADDSGVLPDKPATLKCMVFPADNIDCAEIIDNLVKSGVLVRYTYGTESYLKVAQWDKHQVIKNPSYKYPLPDGVVPEHVRNASGTRTEHVRDTSGTCPEHVRPKRRGEERNGEERREEKKAPRDGRVFSKPDIFEVTDYCQKRGSNIDPREFIDHYEANGWKVGRNSMKNWEAAVRTWESRRKCEKAQADEGRPRVEPTDLSIFK